METTIRQFTQNDMKVMTDFFVSVFTKEPWNDDWSDTKQLAAYMQDLNGNSNSLAFGFYVDKTLTGIAMGCIKHWYSGTEYSIDEFCIQTAEQAKGLGTVFMNLIEKELVSRGIHQIFLQTESDKPAFNFYTKRNFIYLEKHVSFYKSF